MFVLNPLVAPASVSSTVTCIVEVCGAEDFQVAGLATDLGFIPVVAYGPSETEDKYLGYTPFGVHAQSNVYKEDHLNLVCQGPGTQIMQRGNAGRISSMHDSINPLGSPDDQGTSSLYTIGEMITSFRQILKRSALLASTTFAAASRDRVIAFSPFAVYLPTFVSGAAPPVTVVSGTNFIDWYSWITPLYAMRRGGVLTKVYNEASNADCSTVSFLRYYNNVSQPVKLDTSASRNNVNITPDIVISSSTVQGALETHIPFYAASHSVPITTPNAMLTTAYSEPFLFSNNPEQRIIGTSSNNTNYLVLNVMRQVADDFDLGIFLGTLPLHAAGNVAYPV
jgi:hypothetical protein